MKCVGNTNTEVIIGLCFDLLLDGKMKYVLDGVKIKRLREYPK